MSNKLDFNDKKVLIFSPHPDDEIIGCGGLLLKYKNIFSEINCIYFNYGESSIAFDKSLTVKQRINIREKEIKIIKKELNFKTIDFVCKDGIKPGKNKMINIFQSYLSKFNPDIIFLPWYGDSHPDHRLISCLLSEIDISTVQLKNIEVFAYEVRTPILNPNFFIDISDHISEKLKLLSVYKSVLDVVDYCRCVEGLNKYRSMFKNNGIGYSECFMKTTLRDYIYNYKI